MTTYSKPQFLVTSFLVLVLVDNIFIQSGASVKFTDVIQTSGIQFTHEDGKSYKKYFTETLGSGVALLDYDNDNDLDIYFVNGSSLDNSKTVRAYNHLYRNDGNLTFTDVTMESQTGNQGYGTGVCVGDYNNDGWLDMYVTNFRSNVLYRNNKNGTFTDVTETANVDCQKWSTGCSFSDVDGDGDLDLYVANYVDFSIERHIPCRVDGILAYCSPRVYDGLKDVFFRNNGDGTFTQNTEASGFSYMAGRGLGVIFADYDNDSDPDLYVANDADQDLLYQNDGRGFFQETGQVSGVGFSEHGLVENGMGVDFGDYDNDGLFDIVVTNFQHQTNTIYHNEGNSFFKDVSYDSGTGTVTMPYLAWGINFFDFNNDGWLDLFIANGHLDNNIQLFDTSTTYAQINHLFKNNGNGTFTDLAEELGFEATYSSRGSAVGDIDNDGDLDLVISNLDQPPNIMKNNSIGNLNNWLNVKLIGSTCNYSAIGSLLILTAGNMRQIREVRSGSSYLSQSDLRLHFGLGNYSVVDLEVRWPNGQREEFRGVDSNQFIKIIEGEEHLQHIEIQ